MIVQNCYNKTATRTAPTSVTWVSLAAPIHPIQPASPLVETPTAQYPSKLLEEMMFKAKLIKAIALTKVRATEILVQPQIKIIGPRQKPDRPLEIAAHPNRIGKP